MSGYGRYEEWLAGRDVKFLTAELEKCKTAAAKAGSKQAKDAWGKMVHMVQKALEAKQ